MSFSLNGSYIDGGTFNSVSGDMSQTFNSHIHSRVAADGQVLDYTEHLPVRPLTNGSRIGAIRPQRVSRTQDARPYAIPDRIHRNQIELLDWNSSGSSDSRPPGIPENLYDVTTNGGDMSAFDIAYVAPVPRDDSADRRPSPAISHTFNSVGGDMTQLSVTSYGESGMDILCRSVVTEALHDSGERFPEPACHPGTRTALLERLLAWSVDTSPESNVLWLHGSAGMGKSAIAQTFAGDCQVQGRLGASFFFKRGHSKRGTWNGLFTTVSYQLANSIPELHLAVEQAIQRDKLVVGRQMAVQFRKLLVEPFNNTPRLTFKHVIVIDGLDECTDYKAQQEILRLFIGAIQMDKLPVRLLVASRPEPHIREVLEREETLRICSHFVLSADESAYEDVRIYLRDEFSRIHSAYRTRGIDFGPVWPTPEAVEDLVQKSSGAFIYATTVIRFIDSESAYPVHPVDRLVSVLSLDSRSTAPLDDLYTEILSVAPHEPQQLLILHAIWRASHDPNLFGDPDQMDSILALRPGTCRLALRGLHSLYKVPPIRTRFGPGINERTTIHSFHASLYDYLENEQRSGRWCVSIPSLKSYYIEHLIRLLSSPRITTDVRELHQAIVRGLPRRLKDVTPSNNLIALLRHDQFQDSVFLAIPNITVEVWPQRGSPYPLDLIQLWEDHDAISSLVEDLRLSNEISSTNGFDSDYREILSRHSGLVRVLRSQLVKPGTLDQVLMLLGPQYTYRIFQPFLEVQELQIPFPPGDSPLDFLNDPRRAGNIYSVRSDIVEDLVLLWVKHAKDCCVRGEVFWKLDAPGLEYLVECPRSPKILQALETLDLAQLCDPMNITKDHHLVHKHLFGSQDAVACVLAWLSMHPNPSQTAIAFWEKQGAVIRQCPFKDEPQMT